MTTWFDVPGNDLVKVSEDGRVFSCHSNIEYKRMTTKKGYYYINLRISGVKKLLYVHRLVCLAFHENPNNKPQVNHKDGNKLNNHKDNLEWVTGKENMEHAKANGLLKPISQSHLSRLLEASRAKRKIPKSIILYIVSSDIGHTALSKSLNIHPSCIRDIRKKRTYADITNGIEVKRIKTKS